MCVKIYEIGEEKRKILGSVCELRQSIGVCRALFGHVPPQLSIAADDRFDVCKVVDGGLTSLTAGGGAPADFRLSS